MKWSRAPEELVAQFYTILPEDPMVERRKMFGFPCCFANGVMFAGLYQDRMVLKLPDGEREKFLALPDAAPFEPMPGRVMRQYAVVPRKLLADAAKMEPWMTKAFVFAMESGAEKQAKKSPAPSKIKVAKKTPAAKTAKTAASPAIRPKKTTKHTARPAEPARAPAKKTAKKAAKQAAGRAGSAG